MKRRETVNFEIGSQDIMIDMEKYLEEIHALGATLKVPRKAKLYE